MAPFVTGYIAHHTTVGVDDWLIVHVICGEIMLISIPFTKLSHFVLFFMSRGQIGMDYGIKRGGMKGKGFAW
jgi:nitrate reductase gamma subunit